MVKNNNFSFRLLAISLALTFVIVLSLYLPLSFASASTSNGIVENNLVKNNTLENTGNNNSFSGGINNFINSWNLNNGTATWENGIFKHTSNNSWQGVSQDIDPITVKGKTITLTVNCKTTNILRIYIYYQIVGSSRVTAASNNTTSTTDTLLSCTGTIPNTLTANDRVYIMLYNSVANETFYVNWVKLEIGSEFTGFVKKDYENYGYFQGVNTISNTLVNTLNYQDFTNEKSDYSNNYNGYYNYNEYSSNNVNYTKYSSYNLESISTTSATDTTDVGNVSNIYLPSNTGAAFSVVNQLGKSNNSFTIRFDLPSTNNLHCKIYYLLPVKISFLGSVPSVPIPFVSINFMSDINTVVKSATLLQSYSVDSMNNNYIFIPYTDFNFTTSGSSNYYESIVFFRYYVEFDTSLDTPVKYISIQTDPNSSSSYYYPFTPFFDSSQNSTFNVNFTTQDMASFINGIESSGYDTGYSSGYSYGYETGYYNGSLNGNDYSFNRLFASVINVPITALFGNGESDTGLLNFDFLGINLGSFVLSVISIGFLFAVLRFVLSVFK